MERAWAYAHYGRENIFVRLKPAPAAREVTPQSRSLAQAGIRYPPPQLPPFLRALHPITTNPPPLFSNKNSQYLQVLVPGTNPHFLPSLSFKNPQKNPPRYYRHTCSGCRLSIGGVGWFSKGWRWEGNGEGGREHDTIQL